MVPAYSSVVMCCHTGIPCRIRRTRHPARSQYTDMGYDTPPRHSIQTWDTTPRPVTVYRHGIWHPAPSQYTDMGYDTPPRHSIQTWDMTPRPITVYRHGIWHPAPSQYTDTGPTCRCAIHGCGTSHWNTQLPILMSWVRPDQEIIPRPSIYISERSTWCCHGGSQSEAP